MMQRLRLSLLLSFLCLGALSTTTLTAASAQVTTGPRTAAARPADEKAFLVYPNPSNGIVHITLNGFEGRRMELRILNVIGTVIYRETLMELNGPKTLDLTKFASGLYYVKLEGENVSAMRKLVIH